jgi:hypothetical protein
MGPTGPHGPQGIPGYMGAMGPMGPIGPTGNVSSTFIQVFSTIEQKIHHNEPIIFENYSNVYGDCAHLPNTSEIWLWRPGYYFVTAIISQLEAGQFSLVKNGMINVLGGTYGSLTGTILPITSIINISNDDINIPVTVSPTGMCCKIQLVNNSTQFPFITLYGASSAGNTTPQNTASISLLLIQ